MPIRPIAVLLLASGLLLGACTATPSRTASNTPYVEAFAASRYSDAYDAAVEAAAQTRGHKQEEAALVAGLSAHALGRNAEAERWLAALEASTDLSISGKSSATLGLMAQERGEHQSASRLLSQAAKKLQGDEAARAAIYAGDSFHAIQKPSDAQAMYLLAQRRATQDSLRVMVSDRLAGNIPPARTASLTPSGSTTPPSTTLRPAPAGPSKQRLTVQVGAYTRSSSAQAQARRLMDRYSVRVVPILSAQNRQLFAVRVGEFSSRDAAEAVRRNLGGTAAVVSMAHE
jgi:cell division septation protein DedD